MSGVYKFKGTLSGAPATIETYAMQDSETLTVGDMVSVQATSNVGYVDLVATADNSIAGILVGAEDPDAETAAGSIVGTTVVTRVKVVTNRDAIYELTDLNARGAGETFDVAGTTGSMTIAASSNVNLIVVYNSSATEPTQVMIAPSSHFRGV